MHLPADCEQIEGSGAARAVMTAKVRPPRATPGILRERLHAVLRRLGDGRIGLVVAPAGWGKTTLLAQFAASTSLPIAWYQAEPSDSGQSDLLRHLEAAFTGALGPWAGDWTSVEGAVASIEDRKRGRVLLVVDDLHHLEGTPAEVALERLALYAPPGLMIVTASRYLPEFNLPRLWVSGRLIEVGPDDLRFRTWEVERLFRDHYRQILPPEELAQLAQRTGGWPAGLQLFHLATTGKPAAERRRVLGGMSTRSRLVREYLTRNVLDELPPELQEFLIRTSVLGRLNGALCDRLLERGRSQDLLAEIERRRIFTSAVDDHSYRTHEVLRSLLQEILLEREGEAKAQAAHRRAGELLEEAGAVPEALRAYCRAGDREAAGRLLGNRGQQAIAAPQDWSDGLPAALVDHDPWLLLATARRHTLAGRLAVAVQSYGRAEQAFEGESAAETCRLERLAVRAWTEPAFHRANDWIGLLRRATARHPLEVAAVVPGDSQGQLVAGLAALLAGHLRRARVLLAAVDPEAGPLLAAGVCVAAAVAGRLGGELTDSLELDRALETLDSNGLGWLARLTRPVVSGCAETELADLQVGLSADGNVWGAALALLFGGLMQLGTGDRSPALLQEAARRFHALGAGVLESWAAAGAAFALASVRHSAAAQEAREAEALARAAGCDGALLLAISARAQAEPQRASHHTALAEELAHDTGSELLAVNPPQSLVPGDRTAGAEGAQPLLTLRCFGGFALEVAGSELDCASLKPRVRSVLHLLAAHAGRAIHREVVVDALWPELDLRSGVRSLQVAVSSLRQLLDPFGERVGAPLLVREGDAYRLVLPPDSHADGLVFEQALARARAARSEGQLRAAEGSLEVALAAYSGELLPEEGPADWAVKLREHYRMEAAAAAHALAELRLSRGETAGAVTAAEAGLAVDGYRDGLWQLLVTAHREAGEAAASAAAERRYHQKLAELGVAVAARVS